LYRTYAGLQWKSAEEGWIVTLRCPDNCKSKTSGRFINNYKYMYKRNML